MKFKKKVLANGLTVIHEKRDVPVTTVMLAVKYGAAYESVEEKGMAHFIEHLCFKGTGRRSVRQISEEVEKVGGILNAFTHEEITAYYAKLPSNCLDVAMNVIFDIFFNPSFPEDELEKERNVILEEIKMYKDNPLAYVLENIKGNLYKEPFGDPVLGSSKSIGGITRERLFERHREVYIPENSVLCVVGDNDFDEIVKLAESFVVERKGKKSELPKIKTRNLKGVEKRRGLQQANLALGFHFPYLGQNGRYAAEVFSAILGQGMSSKLFNEVREKRGLVYGVKTELDLGKNYGYMVIWAGTDPAKVQEVVDVCLGEYSKMRKIGEKELDDAKVQVIGNWRVKSENSEDVAVNLVLEEVSGKAESYYDYEKKIRAVSLEDIKNLAKISEYASFSLEPQD